MSWATASGREPLVLRLITPRRVRPRMARMLSASRPGLSRGSPSQPWPKLATGRPLRSRWSAARAATSSAVGVKRMRSWVEGKPASGSWKLRQPTQEALQAGGMRHLVDLYCGVGFFGLETAAVVESFVGVEYDRMAIQAARQNAAARGVTNGEFIAGRVEEVLPGVLAQFPGDATAVLLDPPRKGVARANLEQLRVLRPRQVIYVSCHPATMARDLNILCADGVFELMRVTPLDMFPQTQHIECVAALRRAGPAAAAAGGVKQDLPTPHPFDQPCNANDN